MGKEDAPAPEPVHLLAVVWLLSHQKAFFVVVVVVVALFCF